MRKTISKLFSAEKASPLLFLGIIYLVGVTTNSLTDTIKDITKLDSWIITSAGMVILLVILSFLDPVSKFVRFLVKGRGELMSHMGLTPARHKGLIVFCSVGPNISAEQAVRFHYRGLSNEHEQPVLEHCWMITGGAASLEAAKILVESLIRDGVPPNVCKYVPMTGDDADNPEMVYRKVVGIFEDLPQSWSETDVIADYTGGTKSMTAGMILACALPERKLQFLKPRKYKPDGTADRAEGSDPKYIDIHFKVKHI